MNISTIFLISLIIFTPSLYAMNQDQSQQSALEKYMITVYYTLCEQNFRWRREYKNSPSEDLQELIPTNICLICAGNMRKTAAHVHNNHGQYIPAGHL